MDASPTVNSILDYFVPSTCRNDWQRFHCIDVWRTNEGMRMLRLSHANVQYEFEIREWDPEIVRCVVVCTASTHECIRVGTRNNLTWTLLRLAHWNTPACPPSYVGLWEEYDNAHAFETLGDVVPEGAVIPPPPPGPPQLVYG